MALGLGLNRRALLASCAVMLADRARSSNLPMLQVAGTVTIGTGWNTLPLGAGGLVTGLAIASDGSMVCRTDVGNIYRWSGKSTDYADGTKLWFPLLTFGSLGASANPGGNNIGGWEHVLAPGNSSVHLAIFCDMTGVGSKHWLWYSTNAGATWNKSNVAFLNNSADTNTSPYKTSYYKIAIDPVNASVAYCGMPNNSGSSAGVYTSLNQSGGSTLATWTAVTTNGATPIAPPTTGLACGIAIDSSLGTATVGDQTVTKHIILPVGGVGIYESTDGGQTFTEIAVSAFGTSNFYVTNGGFTAAGVYYCVVVSSAVGGLWRYASEMWTNITPPSYSVATFTPGVCLIIDPRSVPTSESYLSVTGPNGIGAGFTATDANFGTPTWRGRTGGEFPYLSAASYDIPYLNYFAGQQSPSAFAYGPATCVDANGVCFWGGNQSLWYFATSNTASTPSGTPNYGHSIYTYSWSMGRGQEATVSQDVLCPPGGTYPILAPQDVGAPMRGTFTTYPQDIAVHFKEYTCNNLEYAASDPSFVVARTTGQNSGPLIDASCYSINYGADGTWTQLNGTPTSLWQASVTATISDGSGRRGFILNVSAIGSGTVLPAALVYDQTGYTGTYYGKIQPYGKSGTTGTGGTGTYYLDTSSIVALTTLSIVVPVQGGQTVAVDHDKWVTVPSGLSQNYIPAFTTNATSTASWSLCSGLPTAYWTMRSWAFGPTSKPLAVGYGADLGTVWACLFSGTTATLYRSINSGASFSSIAMWTVSVDAIGVYCLSVPGYPGELWITGSYTGGSNTNLWHVTNANTSSATVASVNIPSDAALPLALTLGAPSLDGGYPTLYLLGWARYGATQYLYQGTYSRGSMKWVLFGTTGTSRDLPASCQVCGIQSIRGDWNVYQRLYVSSRQSGFAFYSP